VGLFPQKLLSCLPVDDLLTAEEQDEVMSLTVHSSTPRVLPRGDTSPLRKPSAPPLKEDRFLAGAPSGPTQPVFPSPLEANEKGSVSSYLKAGLSLGLAGLGMVVGGPAAAEALPPVAVAETLLSSEATDSVRLAEATEVKALSVSETDPRISQARGPHYVVTNPEVESNGLLLLSLGGTNSYPKDFLEFDKTAAQEGYVALALDYPNTVITTACRTSPQPDPCTLFREEINSGAEVSDLVEVDQLNSIEHRLEAALRHQAEHDPENFGAFVNADGPVWEKIVVVGHSQGAGHAGYLAKKHPMQGAILLAGPQDTTDAGPASWLSAPSATEPSRYFGFLHARDFFGMEKQLDAIRTLRESPEENGDRVGFEAPDGPVAVTEAELGDAHMSVINPGFTEIWQGLLGQAAR